MSYNGQGRQAMPASKLMATKYEFLREKDALSREIKRLRGEVGVLAKRHNNSKREVEELVKKVRSQPPPPIPEREGEKESEQNKKWVEHLMRTEHEEWNKRLEKEMRRKEKELHTLETLDCENPEPSSNSPGSAALPANSPPEDTCSDVEMENTEIEGVREKTEEERREEVVEERETEMKKVVMKREVVVGKRWVKR
jgi:hypothetical protein